MMQVDSASTSKLPASAGGKNAHVPCQNYIVNIVFIQESDYPIFIRLSACITTHVPVDSKLFGNVLESIAIAYHNGDFGY